MSEYTEPKVPDRSYYTPDLGASGCKPEGDKIIFLPEPTVPFGGYYAKPAPEIAKTYSVDEPMVAILMLIVVLLGLTVFSLDKAYRKIRREWRIWKRKGNSTLYGSKM